jgi:UDP-N-acetylmuramyl tripeptide synthase
MLKRQRQTSTNIRFWIALLTGKLVALLCRLFRRSGTSLPGVIALKIHPQLLSVLAANYERIVAVTGTNGKTTTANLITHLLRSSGLSTASNYEGANMLSGVVTALIKDCTILGKRPSQFAVLEVDEGNVGKVFSSVKPDLVVVTNYFRDQLDRYSDLDHNINLLRQVLVDLPQTMLLLNADDPLVVIAGRDHSVVSYYGAIREQKEQTGSYDIKEVNLCPDCGTGLSYYYYNYGQLGDYYCSNCAFRRPVPDFLASEIEDGDFLEFNLHVCQRKVFNDKSSTASTVRFRAQMQGLYNIYNILAAAAAAITLGVSQQTITASLMEYVAASGRMEKFIFKGRISTVNLIKNPIGLNEVIKTLLRGKGEKALVIAINDLAGDGRDVSWLWDAGFEMLDNPLIKMIVCSGRRAGDVAVRLKYAGISLHKIVIEPECGESIEILGEQDAEEYHILASYTCVFNYAKLLRKMGEAVEIDADQSLPSLS